MKMITLVALMFAVPALAKQSKETLNTTATVDMHAFDCITPVGLKQTYTRVGSNRLFLGTPKGVELKHQAATADGCQMDDLTKINDKAMMGFGFLRGVPVVITKETDESGKNGNGQCVANYLETVQLDLGANIIVSSEQSELRSATDCN
jgi:hypothetical protein